MSAYIGNLSVLWVAVADTSGTPSDRAYVERNAIGLLSNGGRPATDPPCATWLGHFADRAAVRESGLWNVNHVDSSHESAFLDRLELYIGGTEA